MADLQELFDELYDEDGFGILDSDREAVDGVGGIGASAYGEIEIDSAVRLLSWLNLGATDHFCDLGSGVGRLCLQALLTTDVGEVTGIELSAKRHLIAETAWSRLIEREPSLSGLLRLRRADFQSFDLTGVTVVYAGSTCFPTELMRGLSRACRAVESLRLLVTIKELPDGGAGFFESIGGFNLAMSWAEKVRVRAYRPIR